MIRKSSLLVVLALIIGACGNIAENIAEEAIERGLEAEGGGNVDIDLDSDGEGSISIEGGAQGDAQMSFGGGELPEGLDIPVVDGYAVAGSSVMSGDDGDFINVILQYPPSEYDALVAYYDDYFDGLEGSTKTESSSEGFRNVSWSSNSGEQGVGLTSAETDDFITVAVTQFG